MKIGKDIPSGQKVTYRGYQVRSMCGVLEFSGFAEDRRPTRYSRDPNTARFLKTLPRISMHQTLIK